MAGSLGYIPRNRLSWIPKNLRLSHEYCFFLHDEILRHLREYEENRAHFIKYNFRDWAEEKKFKEIAEKDNVVFALRACGREKEAQRLVLNQITMAMVSDLLNHIYEAMRCLEKRKVIVALNLFRKPLTDSLLYLSWMLGDENDFYRIFSQSSPRGIASKILKGKRAEIISKALSQTKIGHIVEANFIDISLFDQSNLSGLQRLFQHAVHLITVERPELITSEENFNFIFKGYADNDIYELLYYVLPSVFLYIAHVVHNLFARIKRPDVGAAKAFQVRSVYGFYLAEGDDDYVLKHLAGLAAIRCMNCRFPIKITRHNAARLVLSQSFRCTACRQVQPFPFSWIF